MTHQLSSPEQWLPRYGDILYRYAITRVRDKNAAEDIVQETLLAGLKSKANYAGKSSERTWLIGILKHKMIDYFRKSAREHPLEEDTLITELTHEENDDFFNHKGQWQTKLSTWSKPEQSMEQEQFLAILQTCLENLPQRLSQIFIMRELDGMSSEEICKTLSIPSLNSLWVSLSRSRVQLRHCLDKNWLNQ
ncbi:MAG: sigma-70 family RNA polymerase sigma factor [Methylococcales bacterium]|nr:sigma-70 family RNA polymerase sigma factor [Methylococcales bacterium]